MDKEKAPFRKVKVTFWEDGQINEDLSPEDKYFYLYMLTNPYTTQLGVYEITKKQISSHLGYNMEVAENLLKRFEEYHKLIKYNRDTKEVCIVKWAKYNWDRGGKPVFDLVKKEIDRTKDKSLILLIAQSAPDSWLKEQIRAYLSAQYAQELAQCAAQTKNSENSIALEPEGIQEILEIAHDESYHKKEELRTKKKHMRISQSSTLESDFEEFWNLYGYKKDRKRALSAFKKQLKAHSLEIILEGVKKYKADFAKKNKDKQFFKHPTTFLNGENFLDEYDEVKVNIGSHNHQNGGTEFFNKYIDLYHSEDEKGENNEI